jgi:hypothetical protein
VSALRGTAVKEPPRHTLGRLTDCLSTTCTGRFDPLLPIAHDVGATRRTTRPFATKLDHLGPSEHRSAELSIPGLLSNANGCSVLWTNDARTDGHLRMVFKTRFSGIKARVSH